MKLAVFIDYDNLLDIHKSSGVLDVATKALIRCGVPTHTQKGTCEIRIYGGWYEGPTMTKLAQDLSVQIQKDFPAIVRVPGIGLHTIPLSTTATLAVSMMEEPGHLIFDTYRRKGRPGNLRVQKPQDVGCASTACPLPLAKKLLKKGSCPIPACTILADDLVYRHEQKVVDTLLTCDIVYAIDSSYTKIILISGDDDFLPPIRTAMLRGTPVVRVHPRPGRIRPLFKHHGGTITEFDL